MSEPNPNRVKAYQAGLAAEALVKEQLSAQGYEALAERYKTKNGELDLIMQRDSSIVFVEVKARASVEEGLQSITPKAQRRLAAAATQWMADFPDLAALIEEFRFDVAVVTPDKTVTFVENAFLAEG